MGVNSEVHMLDELGRTTLCKSHCHRKAASPWGERGVICCRSPVQHRNRDQNGAATTGGCDGWPRAATRPPD
eukprot:6378663-Pyramimonas_sp.AAC.1